ncbi:MAG: hypothetical protein WB755_05485, partial [Terriglobales bacterium]
LSFITYHEFEDFLSAKNHVGAGALARPAGRSPAGFNPTYEISGCARPRGRGRPGRRVRC